MKAGRIIFGFLAFGGVAAIALAALILLRTLALAAFGERAEGIVIDNVRTDIDSAPQAVVRSGRNPSRSWSSYSIVSHMCSTVEERLALIGRAIDEVAAAAGAPAV